MQPKSQQQLKDQVNSFNKVYPIGTKVNVRMDSGEIKSCTVYNVATIMGGHSAVGWFEEMSGAYSLDRVQF